MRKNRGCRWVPALLLVGLLSACGGTEVPAPSPDITPPPAAASPAGAQETSQPIPAGVPTPEPLPPREYVLSFGGDCTLGSLVEWQGAMPGDFQSVVGEDYGYPLSGVRDVFASDDFTMVNLEGPLSEGGAPVPKKYRFRGASAYTAILTEGGVEAVSLANNHAPDLGETGREDTRAALAAADIGYTDAAAPLIVELEGGLRLGIVSLCTVESLEPESVWRESLQRDIALCREAGCHVVGAFMHWGVLEYTRAPDAQVKALAHDLADWGCDWIVGGHAHVLHETERYNGTPIAYSMGNFCFGGNLNPSDKDSVILQAVLRFDPETEAAELTELRALPCLISSRRDKNDYCPQLCPEEGEDYARILERLGLAPKEK